ncbi:hypothetical protein ACFE04_014158 [Oxalis oulophora]
MGLSDEEIRKLCRVRNTLMQMLRDRGYLVLDSELNLTKQQFIDKFGENMKREDQIINKSKPNDESDQIYVFFPDREKVGVADIKGYINRLRSEKVFRAIVAIQKQLSPFARSSISEVSSVIHLEVFQEVDLLVNITDHVLVPKHQVLIPEEKKALLEKYTVKETQMPRILVTDPVARYYGLKRGEVVKIIRPSDTAGAPTYRCARGRVIARDMVIANTYVWFNFPLSYILIEWLFNSERIDKAVGLGFLGAPLFNVPFLSMNLPPQHPIALYNTLAYDHVTMDDLVGSYLLVFGTLRHLLQSQRSVTNGEFHEISSYSVGGVTKLV